MPKYIDVEEIKNVMCYEYGKDSAMANGWSNWLIEKLPTADVAPVVHAHWTISEYEYYDCSHCGESYYTGADSTKEARENLKNGNYFAYCPHCGAKMDGEK